MNAETVAPVQVGGVLHHRMAHLHVVGRQRKELERLPLRRARADQTKNEIVAFDRPRDAELGARLVKRLGYQRAVLGQDLRVRRLRGPGGGERQIQFLGSRDANLRANQPLRLGMQRHIARRKLPRRRDLGQQHNFIAVAVVLDVARGRDFLRDRPLDRASLEARRQLPGDLGWQARVATVLPVGVPMRLHLQPQPDREWLARRDCSCVRQETRLDQFHAIEHLRARPKGNDQRQQREEDAKAAQGRHRLSCWTLL